VGVVPFMGVAEGVIDDEAVNRSYQRLKWMESHIVSICFQLSQRFPSVLEWIVFRYIQDLMKGTTKQNVEEDEYRWPPDMEHAIVVQCCHAQMQVSK